MIAAFDWSRFLAGYGEAVPHFFAAVAPPRRTAAVPRAGGDEPRASRAALAGFVAREARRCCAPARTRRRLRTSR